MTFATNEGFKVSSDLLMGQLRSKWPFLAALGAGCLVGASGIILVQRLSRRVHLASPEESLSKELTSLYVTLEDLKDAIRELKEDKTPHKPLKSAIRNVTFAEINNSLDAKCKNSNGDTFLSPSTSSAYLTAVGSSAASTDYHSAISSDEDEYFDVKDDENLEENSHKKDGANQASSVLSESDFILELFRVVDDLCVGDEKDQGEALKMLRKNERDLAENSEFLWRLCKAVYLSSTTAGILGDNDLKRDLIFEAVKYGKRALDCAEKGENSASSEAHKWYAIAVGSRGEFLGIKEKILDGFEFKKHVDVAAKLAPDDHTIQHLLGRFCYEVAELSWFERKMASTLFAEPPLATMEEAKNHFLAAEAIKSEGWKENRLFLAKSWLKMQSYDEALKWLDKAADLPIKNQDDQQAHEDVLQLLEDNNKYRS